MFPRPPWPLKLWKFFGWKPSAYGNIQQTFYARVYDPRRPSNPDIWGKLGQEKVVEPREEEVLGPKEYSYFEIKTAVGVGAKGKNNIKRVHIRFRLIPMKNTIRDPEVVSIYPHSISQLAGQRKVSKMTKKQLEWKGKGGAGTKQLSIVDANSSVESTYGKSSSEETGYSLPYHVVIANASGTGSRAMWEFYQEEKGMAAIGQFDLKIFFRIPKNDISSWPTDGIIRDLYCIDWNVEINRKRLVDHNIDFNGNWNMKVNGRHLMDRQGTIEYEEISDRWKFHKRDNKRLYHEKWNVPIPNLPPKKLKKYKKKIYNMMIEEEPKAEEHRLLRPLYLVRDAC